MKIAKVFKILIPIGIVVAIGAFLLTKSVPTAIVSETRIGTAVNAVPGTVIVLAEQEMLIRGEHGGRVITSNFETGGTVAKGDMLIQLDTGDIDLDIERSENEYDRAKRNLEIRSPLQLSLDTSLDTLNDLKFRFERGGVRELDVTKAQRALDKIKDDIAREDLKNEASLQNLENTLKRLKRRKEQMTIISPIDGIITEVYAYEGDLIGVGATLAKVVSQTRIVEAKVSEEHFVGLEVGMPAQVAFLGIDGEQFQAKVKKIIPVADSSTQRFTVHLEVDIDRERLDPGLTGDATITLDEREDALQIPRQAVVSDSVLVIDNGVVERREIDTGYTSITAIEVLGGLQDGDQVIVEDLHLFDDGDRVKIEARQ